MNKTCARCEKTVYPTEELKCLDKVWHKGCFKCQECGMTLNMRTYKGYGKLPYCESHVPKAKHTTMAETPELKRIAENTKIQSNVKYHADFERSKGKFTQVADDPETLRIKANTKIISNVAYHGDLEKKAIMERQRQINENGEIVDVPSTDNYHQQIESYATEMLPSSIPAPNLPPKNHYQTPNVQYQAQQMTQHQANQQQINQQHFNQHQVNQQMNQQMTQHQINNQHQSNNQNQLNHQHQHQNNQPQHQSSNQPQHQSNNQPQHQSNNQPQHQSNNQPQHQTQNRQYQEQQTRQYTEQYYRQQQQQQTQQSQKYDDSYNYPKYDEFQNQYTYGQYQQPNYGVGSQQKIGRIQDYDPLSDGPRPPPNTQRASATLIYNSTNDAKRAGARQSQPQQTRQIGRVTDMDPLANEPPRPANHSSAPVQRVYIAMYDYEANDSDEVSFREGDLISNVTSIDEGWMTGQVIRTGHTGMLPANYVEIAPAGSVPGYNW